MSYLIWWIPNCNKMIFIRNDVRLSIELVNATDIACKSPIERWPAAAAAVGLARVL